MTNDREINLTPSERAALDRLPRSKTPDAHLKERIRRDLRARGAFATRRRPPWQLAAAGIALFLAGTYVGQLVSGTPVREAVIATNASLAPAERIQVTGSEYVETIAQLVARHDSLPAATAEQGRGATLSALRGAAEYALRLPGLDPRTADALATLRGVRDQ